MTIDLGRLEQASAEVSGEISDAHSLLSEAGVQLAAPVSVHASAEGSASLGVWVRGSFSGRLRETCRRCLEPLELEVGEEFEVFFDPKASEPEQDLTLYVLDPRAEELDLQEPVVERFLLARPEFPICREGCRGLCAHCGANLNDGTCDCGEKETDPRWGPLQKLKSDI